MRKEIDNINDEESEIWPGLLETRRKRIWTRPLISSTNVLYFHL